MNSANLMLLLAKWGSVAAQIGNPVWEKSHGKRSKDRDSSSHVKRDLLLMMNPVVESLLDHSMSVESGKTEEEVYKGLVGLEQLLSSSLEEAILQKVSLVVCRGSSGFYCPQFVAFIEEKCGHSLTGEQRCKLEEKDFRDWFTDSSLLSEEEQLKWAKTVCEMTLKRYSEALECYKAELKKSLSLKSSAPSHKRGQK